MTVLEVLRALKETLEKRGKAVEIEEAVFGWLLNDTIKTSAAPDLEQLRADVHRALFEANLRRSLSGETDIEAPYVDNMLANLNLAIIQSVGGTRDDGT